MKPMPAIAPPPASAAQPTGRRSRPRLSRVASHEAPTIPDGLAGDVRDEDPERDGRRERAREEAAVDRNAGVRQREERHDHVARPRVEEVLQPLVGRDRGLEPDPRRARELGRRLLAEQPEQVGGALEVDACGRIRVREQAHDEADDHGVDARLEDGDPHRRRRARRRRALAGRRGTGARARTTKKPAAAASGTAVRSSVYTVAITSSATTSSTTTTVSMNARRRAENARPDEREHAERERGVGRHRGSPAVRRRMAGVEREVDRDGHDHAADPGEQRQREAAALAQLAHVELAARLEADDEEEERHQPVVDPVPHVLRQAGAADADRQVRRPEVLVGRRVDVDPDERRDRRGEQDDRTARLGAEELAQRRADVARPGGAILHQPIVTARRVRGGAGSARRGRRSRRPARPR